MRLVCWNIRAGGGVRANAIAEQLAKWAPDVVALVEYRATPPSLLIAAALSQQGLIFQRTTASVNSAAVNSVLVASRWPLRKVQLARAPGEQHRWLHVNVSSPTPVALMALHIPNRATGRKYPFMQAVQDVVKNWRGQPAIISGDTNSGMIRHDEESSAFNRIEDSWMRQLSELGWQDAFRVLHGTKREFTWYSPNAGNGFRLDQMFLHPRLVNRIQLFQHVWAGADGGHRTRLSDHAAMIADIRSGSARRRLTDEPPSAL